MRTIELENGAVRLIDQRRLPLEFTVMECRDYRTLAEAIRTLAVRGAPAIGVSAAAGVALAARSAAAHHPGSPAPASFWAELSEAADFLRATRPTAVNLFWGINRAMAYARTLTDQSSAAVADALWQLAAAMAEEDVSTNRAIGVHGRDLIPDGAGVLTHCNTGALACVDHGTAFGVVRAAHEAGKQIHLYVDETRPVLQGARLTAWEAVQNGIPATLITDNMAAHFMRLGKIQVCIVGADRIAANGDTANKIGTYGVAVLAKEHGIPFYIAAPLSTVDLSLASGDQIPIEERRHEEVTHIGGVQIAPPGIGVANPAFDVTPARYITGIITEQGVIYPPFAENLRRAFARAASNGGAN